MAGCSSLPKDPLISLKGYYFANATIKANGLSVEADIRVFTDPSKKGRFISIDLSAPSELAGLSVVGTPSELTVSLGGVELSLDAEAIEKLSYSGFLRALLGEAEISSVSSLGGAAAGLDGYSRVIKLSCEGFDIYIDPENSVPVKITALSSGSEIFIFSFQRSLS